MGEEVLSFDEWIPMEEVYDLGDNYIELKPDGTGCFMLDGDPTTIKWKLTQDGALTLDRDGSICVSFFILLIAVPPIFRIFCSCCHIYRCVSFEAVTARGAVHRAAPLLRYKTGTVKLMQEQKVRAREARKALGDLAWAGIDLGLDNTPTSMVRAKFSSSTLTTLVI